MRRLGASLAAVALVAGSGVSSSARPAAAVRHLPHSTCTAFPADNVWQATVNHLPVNKHSAQWVNHIGRNLKLHPDFGPSFGAQPVPYGIPITYVRSKHATVHVRFDYSAESDHVRYPLGADTKIEGGKHANGDRHAVIVNTSTCRLYELYNVHHTSHGWTAGSGAVWSLASNKLRPKTWTSADAAGLPILPGLLRYDEVKAGHVDHAIRFTAPTTSRHFLWPARHEAGAKSGWAYPPMGARFRLKAGFAIGHYRKDTQVVLRAMKAYGLILADNGSPWFFQGASSTKWPNAMLDQLKTIPAKAFVAVDEFGLRVSANSAQARSGN